MYKNILIIGPGRAGKTTLSKMLNKKYGYSIISIDDIVTALEVFNLGISWESNHVRTAKNMAPFLTKYLKELSEGNKFFDEKFKQYNIKSFDTSKDREKVLKQALKYIEENAYGKKDTN